MITKLEKFKKLVLEKKEDTKHSYGCIMGFFDDQPLNYVTADTDDYKIAEEDIFNDDEDSKGLERPEDTHVTLLYGIHDDVEEDDVVDFLKVLKMPMITFNDISCFKNEEFEVLKWDVEASELHVINKLACDLFEYTNKFPDYHPHVTIGYLKPSTGDTYSKTPNNIVNLPIKYWVYSLANGRKIKIDNTGTVEILREAGDVKEEKNESFNAMGTREWTKGAIITKENHTIATCLAPWQMPNVDCSRKYKEYWISLKPIEGKTGKYFCCVKKNKEDENYLMALKGPVSYETGIKDAQYFVDVTIEKATKK